MATLKEWMATINDDYLIKLSNKGVFNRSKRELPDAGVNAVLEDDALHATFGDGTTVSITGEPTNYVCSCPSRTICKHVVMALMTVYDPTAAGDGAETEAPPPPVAKPQKPVKAKAPKVDAEIIPHVIELMEEIYRIGLFRLPSEYSERCAQFATLCHGAGFAVLERLFDTAAKEFELYEKKSSSFSELSLVGCLARIYQFCRGGDYAETAGRFKRQYSELSKLPLLGLGAYPWYAKSGYLGITAVFYSPEHRQTFTFTNARPQAAANRNALDELKQVPWNVPANFTNLSKSDLVLFYPKISEDNRLSSSESTSGSLVQLQAKLEDVNPMENFMDLKPLFDCKRGVNSLYVVLKVHSLGDGAFNEVDQTYRAVITDANGVSLPIVIAYSEINETAISNFEYMMMNDVVPDAVTANVSLSEENFSIEVFPIAVWMDGKTRNIGYETLYAVEEEPDKEKKDGRIKKEKGYARFFT